MSTEHPDSADRQRLISEQVALEVIQKSYGHASEHILSCIADRGGVEGCGYRRLNNDSRYRQHFKGRSRTILNDSPGSAMLKIIRERMRGLTMSPKNRSLYEKFYLYPSRQDEENFNMFSDPEEIIRTNRVPLNASRSRITKFFQYVKGKADELRQQTRNVVDGERLVVVGSPGTGKTTFLNYVFSCHGDELRRNKIIHFRVDLNNVAFAPTAEGDLLMRLVAQVISILSRFYMEELCGGQPLDQLASRFAAFLRSTPNIMGACSHFRANTEPCLDALCSIYFEFLYLIATQNWQEVKATHGRLSDMLSQHLSVARTPDAASALAKHPYFLLDFTRLFLSFQQSILGYGFIIIFDGLDSVTFSQVHFDAYAKWLRELPQVASNAQNPFFKAAYIITIREYSYLRLGHSCVQPERAQDIGGRFIDLYLAPSPACALLAKRKAHIRQEINDRFADAWKYDLDTLLDHMMCTLAGLVLQAAFSDVIKLRDLNMTRDEELINSLMTKLFHNNHRLMFICLRDTITLMYDHFASNSLDAFHELSHRSLSDFANIIWMVQRLLITGTPDNMYYLNQYEYNSDGLPRVLPVYPVIPNVFNFNEYASADPNGAPWSWPRALTKLRMIQHLLTMPDQSDTIMNVLRAASFVLGCTPEMLRSESRELIFFDIIQIVGVGHPVEGDRWNYLVRLTPKHEVIFAMLKTSIYYETVLDNTPLPEVCPKAIYPLHWSDKPLNVFMAEKTRFVLFFLAYLSQLDSMEAHRFSEATPQTGKMTACTLYTKFHSALTHETVSSALHHAARAISGLSFRNDAEADALLHDLSIEHYTR